MYSIPLLTVSLMIVCQPPREPEKKRSEREDVISDMISASQDGNCTDSVLGAQASAVIMTGSGATAVTVTYTVWAILSQPAVKAKLEEEVSSIPDDYNDTILEKLPYMTTVMLETLRCTARRLGRCLVQRLEKASRSTGLISPARRHHDDPVLYHASRSCNLSGTREVSAIEPRESKSSG